MNPLLAAALKGALGAAVEGMAQAVDRLRDRSVPLDERLEYAEGLMRRIGGTLKPAAPLLGAVADLLAEARGGT